MSEQHNQKNKKHKVVTEVDDLGRKKFTLVEDQNSDDGQKQPNDAFITTGRHRSTLINRDEKIDTNKYVGKIDNNKKNKKTQVFYCQVCKLGFKCDIAYISHINSGSHNRNLGMNMKVANVSKETVVEKLRRIQEEKRSKINKKEAKMIKTMTKNLMKQNQENELEGQSDNEIPQVKQAIVEKQQEIQKKEASNQEQQQPQNNSQEERMQQFLGFSSFGSKRNKKY